MIFFRSKQEKLENFEKIKVVKLNLTCMKKSLKAYKGEM